MALSIIELAIIFIMCLILFSFNQYPDSPLVIAANRDEFYHRPTATLEFWEDNPDILAGRDLQAGGTWMGINRNGRFAAVTNIREGASDTQHELSRGKLCSDFLSTDISSHDFLSELKNTQHLYSGFNFLAGTFNQDKNELFFTNNRSDEIVKIQPGTYGISNGKTLNDNWPKIITGKKSLSDSLEAKQNFERESLAELLDVLTDNSIASDDELPNTGIGIESERLLSSRFIALDNYGTRASTIMAIKRDQGFQCEMLEQTFLTAGKIGDQKLKHFKII